MYKSKGFTLIEMLVVIAIIGILSTIAVPAFGAHIAKAKLTTAQADVALLSLKFENRYQRVLSYPTTAKTDTAGIQTLITSWTPGSKSDDFEFSNTDATATTYTITATGKNGKTKDCVITINQNGQKAITNCDHLTNNNQWL